MGNKITSSALIKQYAVAIGFAIATALGIRIFLYEAYRVPTRSMHPTLEPGDTVFVSKLPYLINPQKIPKQGSVIIYLPSDEPYRHYVRRVVGLPKDTLSYKDGVLLLNGKIITHSNSDLCTQETLTNGAVYSVCREHPNIENFENVTVPDNHVFVMGDLRNHNTTTLNGQNWAVIPIKSIKANALFIWISIEPAANKNESGFFSRIRFNRFLKRVE